MKLRDREEGEINSIRCADGTSREGMENLLLDLAMRRSLVNPTGAVVVG